MIHKIIAVLMLIGSNVFSHGVSNSDKHGLVTGGLLDYLVLGAKHMVTGYDHILFLLGVVFFLSKLGDIVKFVTTFTVGHSISLIFATYYEITANYYLVDAVIAISVIYKGFENLDGFQKVFKIQSPNLITMVFGFGLIHGFGLSTRLQELPLGDHSLIGKILSFNAGVELGQTAALIPILVIVNLLRKQGTTFSRFSRILNGLLVIIGIGLFGFQMNGYIQTQSQSKTEWKSHDHGQMKAFGSATEGSNLDEYLNLP